MQNSLAGKFAWDIKVGIKIKTSPVVSLKLHAHVQSIVSIFGSGYWYTGGGVIIAYPNYATVLQFYLGGAILFNFKKSNCC